MEFCDLVLFDIKETDKEKHIRYTGVPLEPILKNLDIINESEIPFIIRLPVIPTLNDRAEHFYKVKSMVSDMRSCKGIEIMPYHSLGAYKYKLLSREYLCADIPEPDNDTLNKWNLLIKG